jgi:hypothetical protein
MDTSEQIAQAYGITKAQGRKVAEVAWRLGVNPSWLAALIYFESNFDPKRKGPGTAYGLGQFTSIAKTALGVTQAQIERMSFDEQMDLLYRHLSEGKKAADNVIDLAMNHFYPRAFGQPDYVFPASVQSANPGIRTPRDYVAKMIAKAKLPLDAAPEFVGPIMTWLPPVGTPADDGWKFWFNIAGLTFFGAALVASAARLARRRV